MKLIDVYSKLRELSSAVLLTSDVAAYFKINIAHASKLLARLADAKQIIQIKRGSWVFSNIDTLALPSLLTAPFPAYISLQTALYYHGMISQIPSVIYSVSLARTQLYKTKLATISIHHIQPEFFFGYEQTEHDLVLLATPEKALLDVLYLSPAKSRLFAALPELEFPSSFKKSTAIKIIQKIPSIRRKSLVERQFDLLWQR